MTIKFNPLLPRDRRQSMSVEFSKQITKAHALSTSNEEEFRVQRIESILKEMGEGKRVSNLHTKIRRLLKKYKERISCVNEGGCEPCL